MNTPNRRAESELLISYLTLRRVVGFLGLALPSLLILAHFVVAREFMPSISEYYYTELNPMFEGILWSIAVFLLTYKGYERSDHIAAVLAGLGGLGVALLPCGASVPVGPVSRWLVGLDVSMAHYLCAALFLGSLAYISLFEFTKSQGVKTEQKKTRNKVYRAAGYVMLACLVVLGGIGVRHWLSKEPIPVSDWVLVFESIAVVAFAYSWLVKGEFWFKDEHRRAFASASRSSRSHL